MTSIIGKTSCKLSHPHGSTHSHSYSVQRGYGFQIFMRSSTTADVYYIIIEEYLYPAIIAAQDVIKKKGVSMITQIVNQLHIRIFFLIYSSRVVDVN